MNKNRSVSLLSLVLLAIVGSAAAEQLADIKNYREYSDMFASSGQPGKKQLRMLRDAGFERVVYIAFTNSGSAYSDEDQVVKELGMDYVQIPVDWERPTASDFYAFAGIMQSGTQQKTLLHCQVNFRASAFSFLYRVIYEDAPVAEAKMDMNSVWQPNEVWRDLILQVLAENGVSADCDGCDWSVTEMQH